MSDQDKKDFTVDVPDMPMPDLAGADMEIVKDECRGAFKMAFVGAGQGGSRIAEAFWKMGYRRVCCINTNKQDLAAIQIPDSNKLIMDIGTGGAGKDPARGAAASKQYYEDIYDLLKRSFGREFDRIMVCIGAGGGTGSGTVETLVQIAHDIAKSYKVELPDSRPVVGVITSLPRAAEGKKVNENALGVMGKLFGMVGTEKGKMGGRRISPLIVLDNDRINRIYPSLPVSEFWNTANRSVSALFHLFNSIALEDSEFTTFDRADFEDILDSGVVSFGACPIREWKLSTDISHAIRDNLKNNVLVGGFDIGQAKVAGCVFVGSKDVLESIPQEHLEHGFEMLSRIMKAGGTVHRGIYKGSKQGLVVYSAMGELGQPSERMAEITRIAKGS